MTSVFENKHCSLFFYSADDVRNSGILTFYCHKEHNYRVQAAVEATIVNNDFNFYKDIKPKRISHLH